VIVPKEKGPQWSMNRIERGRMQGQKHFFSCPSWLDWSIVANKKLRFGHLEHGWHISD